MGPRNYLTSNIYSQCTSFSLAKSNSEEDSEDNSETRFDVCPSHTEQQAEYSPGLHSQDVTNLKGQPSDVCRNKIF